MLIYLGKLTPELFAQVFHCVCVCACALLHFQRGTPKAQVFERALQASSFKYVQNLFTHCQ